MKIIAEFIEKVELACFGQRFFPGFDAIGVGIAAVARFINIVES